MPAGAIVSKGSRLGHHGGVVSVVSTRVFDFGVYACACVCRVANGVGVREVD